MRHVGALVLVVVVAVLAGGMAYQSVTSAAPSFGEVLRGSAGSITAADGLLPDGTSVFDRSYPGISRLTPALLAALRRAATDAGRDGVTFVVNSGWRSRAYQAELLSEAEAQYGSLAEASRWVATPDTSPHVSGDAVDLGGSDADHWLSAHGPQYGLCQIYRNEPWHFELRASATVNGHCPPMYADPTRDPRMSQ